MSDRPPSPSSSPAFEELSRLARGHCYDRRDCNPNSDASVQSLRALLFRVRRETIEERKRINHYRNRCKELERQLTPTKGQER